jgi:uncharacterized membrane protein YoaK (UPF0700 family)
VVRCMPFGTRKLFSTKDSRMDRHVGSPNEWLSLSLAFVGGYGDAAGFVIAKTFTGHVTGSLVLTTISLAAHDWRAMFGHATAVVFFLAGIPLSVLVDRALTERTFLRLLPTVLLVEIVLIGTASLTSISHAVGGKEMFVICMSLALGLQNGAFRRTGGISVHTTYLTGTITTLIATQMERSRTQAVAIPAAAPDLKVRASYGIWIAFVVGSGAGAAMALHFGEAGILGAALILLVVSFGVSLAERRSTS